MENKKYRGFFRKTKEFRFNNYVVNPHVNNIIGDVKGKALLDVGCGFGRNLEIYNRDNPTNSQGAIFLNIK